MTGLLLVLLTIVASICAESAWIPKDPPRPELIVDPNSHPRDTLFYYLNNLTDYIYAGFQLGVDPRTAFFKQDHQLRIYETLNHYVEENYGSMLRDIIPTRNHYSEDNFNDYLTPDIVALADSIAEMYFQVIYSSGDRPVDQERLQQVKAKGREVINTYAKYATTSQLIQMHVRMATIHYPVLKKFNKTIWGEKETMIKVKREAHIDIDQLKEQLKVYLQKLNVNVYGASEVEYLSKKLSNTLDIFNQPLASQIAFKRFLQANYREVLERDLPSVIDKEAKEHEIEEIKQIEQKTTAVWFEVVNYANLDLLKNQTIIDGINAAIAERLEGYMYFRSLEEIKETNRKIQEVYGHLFKGSGASSYLILLKVFKELRLAEYYSEGVSHYRMISMNKMKLAKYAEAMWQPKHGASQPEKRRLMDLLEAINDNGINFLLNIFEVQFYNFAQETGFEPEFFDNSEFKLRYNETEFMKEFDRYDANDKELERFFKETLVFNDQLTALYLKKIWNPFGETGGIVISHPYWSRDLNNQPEILEDYKHLPIETEGLQGVLKETFKLRFNENLSKSNGKK